jgi:hypothetical protein
MIQALSRSPFTPAIGCLRRLQRPPPPGEDGQTEPDRAVDSDERQSVRCRACGHEVTTREDGLEVDGRHRHTFFNPAGVLYEIACYGDAPGCDDLGTPTDQFSWFPSFSWRYSLCGACRSHLGWQFLGADGESFWGLIVDRLEEG